MFTIDQADVKYKETRRGIVATAPILKDGVLFATLEDTPEQIVAPVFFEPGCDQELFLQDARAKGRKEESELLCISEHARALLAQAEDKLLKHYK